MANIVAVVIFGDSLTREGADLHGHNTDDKHFSIIRSSQNEYRATPLKYWPPLGNETVSFIRGKSAFGTQRSGLYRGVSSHQGWPL